MKFFPVNSPALAYSRPPHGGRGLKYRGHEERPEGHGRPPHGGRGLKYEALIFIPRKNIVAPRTGGVD